jgi:hypothetical protein
MTELLTTSVSPLATEQVRPTIFGVGAHRTGTTSLAAALTLLGFRTSHWTHHGQILREAFGGEFRLSLTETYDALLDLPIPLFYRELDAAYPDGLFILTVREPQAWLQSVERHVSGRAFLEEERLFFEVDSFEPDACMERYLRHNREVTNHFAGSDRFLVIDIAGGDGWDRLAPFCGKSAPSVPFPFENSSGGMSRSERLALAAAQRTTPTRTRTIARRIRLRVATSVKAARASSSSQAVGVTQDHETAVS